MVGGFQTSLDLARRRIPGYLLHIPTPTVVQTGVSIRQRLGEGGGYPFVYASRSVPVKDWDGPTLLLLGRFLTDRETEEGLDVCEDQVFESGRARWVSLSVCE